MRTFPDDALAERARLALDTILQRPTTGIPSKALYLMEHAVIDRLAGAEPNSYCRDPEVTYLAMQRNVGTCLIDQYIPRNPLTMATHGYEEYERKPTTGASHVELDGITIDSPEAVVRHIEQVVIPGDAAAVEEFDEDARVEAILRRERELQGVFGPTILKSGYGYASFPTLLYFRYGYENYLMAYGLYPDVMERAFSAAADRSLLNNRAAARAHREGDLPPMYRLDHDMADSRGTLVSPESLDRLWFPHFARCIEPLVKEGVKLLWHCDGNLMAMVPRLLECGVAGFQGFQYEDGMDYERICRMKTRDGDGLLVMAGVSVTRTLPSGTPDDVRRELAWLVESGPRTGLFLGASSSVTPGTPWANIEALVEGLRHYRASGRS